MLISPAVVADIARVKAYATAHQLNVRDVLERVGRPDRAVGIDPGFRLVIPVGFRTVYSLEEHPGGVFHHLSMSVPEAGRFPNECALLEAAKLFGMPIDALPHPHALVWLEGNHAVNVLVPVNPETMPNGAMPHPNLHGQKPRDGVG